MYSRRDKAESKESPRKANDSLESLLRNMGNEPFRGSHDKLCYYWPDANFAGWPLQLASPNFTTHKCEKCAREKRTQEFYSLVNCRRHMKSHRKTPDKDDLSRSRDDIAEFWNQLSHDQASKIVTLTDSTIDVLSGTDTAKALTSFAQQVTLSYHSQTYFRAGIALENIQKAIRRGTPVSADELFKTMDDASEKTFLTGGTSVSIVRYVTEVPKVLEDEKNSVALAAFLVEDNLVKAWNADKDEKALRVQEALVEEEEAAQKKREKIMEKRRLKKLRQKEKKGTAADSTAEDFGGQDLEVTAEPVDASEVAGPVADIETLDVAGPGEVAEPNQMAASSEGSDHVDTDAMETRLIWADEVPEPREAPTKLYDRKPFSVNGVKGHGTFSKRQRPNYQRGTKSSSNTPTSGYSRWTRKDKVGTVRDASTDIANQHEDAVDTNLEEEPKGRPSENLEELPKHSETIEEPDDVERAEGKSVTISESGTGEAAYNAGQPDGTASLEDQLNEPDVTVAKALEVPSELEGTEGCILELDTVPDEGPTETEGLLIGSLNIPWALTPVEQKRGPKVVVMAENDAFTSLDSLQCVEMQVETQILLDASELASAWETQCRRFLSDRWAEAVASPGVAYAATETEASESQDDGVWTPPEPGGVAEVETVGSSGAATPSGNVGAETDEKRVEVKNGGYRKGSRWQKASKEKALEQRYLPKKQAPA